MCGETTRLPGGALDADGCVRCDACAVEMCRDCSGQRRRRRTWRCDTCVNAGGLGEAELDDDVGAEPAGEEARPLRRACSLDAATVLASRLGDEGREPPDVAAAVLGPLAVGAEARSRRPSDDTPPSNEEEDDEDHVLALWRKQRRASSSPSSSAPVSPRAVHAVEAPPPRVDAESGGEADDTQPYDDAPPASPPAAEPASAEADEEEPVDEEAAPVDEAEPAPPAAETDAPDPVPEDAAAVPRARLRIVEEEEEDEAADDDEAEEAALLARLATCSADLESAASTGDGAAATAALDALAALGDRAYALSSYDGLGATGVIQALKRLKRPRTFGGTDATAAVRQAAQIFEKWKAANGAIMARSDADPLRSKRLGDGVARAIAAAADAVEPEEEEEDEEDEDEAPAMVVAQHDRTARGVQRADRLWALFERDDHGQEWWGGTVVEADLNEWGDGDVDVVFDDGERVGMVAKECFRRCEAGILRSLRQPRPNKKAERALKRLNVVPRENHDIRLPPTGARAGARPTKKRAKASVGDRTQARAESVWAAKTPSSASDAWAAVERADVSATQTKVRKRAAAPPAPAPAAKRERTIPRRKAKARAPEVELLKVVPPKVAPRKPKPAQRSNPPPAPRRPPPPAWDHTTSPLLMAEKGCEAAVDSHADLDFVLRDACVRAGRLKPANFQGTKEASNLFGYCSFWAGSAPSRTRTRPLPSLECAETHQKLRESILGFTHKAKPDPSLMSWQSRAAALAASTAKSWLKANDETSEALEDFERQCATADWTDGSCGVHRVDNPRGQTCELVCKAAPKLRAHLRLEVLFRLKRRHARHVQATCAGDFKAQQLEEVRFLTQCLVVLLKYGALLSDPGQHGMLPLAVFDTLEKWGCEGEGFATPLNATLPSYCSLHADADRCFGSLGSFFEWRPKMGNFELNPPFTIRSTAVEDHAVALLQAAERDGKALSFCYVVPETASRLQTRKHIRKETPFMAGELMVRASAKWNSGVGAGHIYRRGNEFQMHTKQP